MTSQEIIKAGIEAIKTEITGLEDIVSQIDKSFAKAVETIASINGKVILTGVGKSGIIARKIASTMVSTGTPAIFIHPLDSLHGDLGAVSPLDATLILSNSGKTQEILNLIQPLKNLKVPIIAITGDVYSPLARKSDIIISCKVKKEAGGLGLAPTTSTTAQIAIGDALALVVSHMKGFDKVTFKAFHPGGELGKQLMSKIKELMITGSRVPMVPPDAPLTKVITEMTDKSLGFTLVGDRYHIEGIITDGDLRRALIKHHSNVSSSIARDTMTKKPRQIQEDTLAVDALDIMEKYQITSLVVTDSASNFLGVVHLHDLLGRGKLSIKNI